MSIIARLGVWLGINTTEFVKGLDDATKKTREFERNQKQALKEAQKAHDALMAAAGRGLAGIAAAALATAKAFQYADQIEDTAAAYDVTTASLIAMQAAMQGAGGEAENIGTALNKLASSQQDAIDGSDELRKAFTELKISGKDVETLNLQDLFKRVVQELSQVEDAGKRAALQQQILGKAMKGVDASTFVNKYKEMGDPALIAAIKENAQAWDNIELAMKNIAYFAQKAVEPLAKIVNSYDEIFKKIKKFSEFSLGISGVTEFGITDYGNGEESLDPNKKIAPSGNQGDYSKETEKNKNAAKKAAEARAQLQIEIALIQQKIKLQNQIHDLDMEAVFAGSKSVENKKNELQYDAKLAEIKANAAKERSKEGAQIDLINKKEEKERWLALSAYKNEFDLRQAKENYLHDIKIKAIRDESEAIYNSQTVQTWNALNILDLESEKFKLGSDAYELAKLEVEENDKLREIHLRSNELVKQITTEYELSGKSAKDLQIYEENIAKIRGQIHRELDYTVLLEEKKQSNLKEQQKIQNQLFELDLTEQKNKELFAIESQYNTQSKLLDLENIRFSMSTNSYNLEKLRLENVFGVVAAEQKYLQQQKDAYAEMQRQGGGQKAREQYDSRIKAIGEVRDAELEAITKINEARQRNLDNEIARQKSFTEGWKDASKRYQEDAENAFSRGGQAFTSVMDGMGKVMTTWAETGKWKFNDFALSVIGNLIRIELQAQATQLFSMLGSSISSFFTPKATPGSPMAGVAFQQGKASGGFINAPTIVGENGAELFVPNTPGTIIPSGSWQQAAASMGNSGFTNNGTYIASMSAIDTQSAQQFLASNKNTIWAAYQSVNRSIPISR